MLLTYQTPRLPTLAESLDQEIPIGITRLVSLSCPTSLSFAVIVAKNNGTSQVPPQIVFTNLTPFIPLSFKGEGEEICREGFHPSLNYTPPSLAKGRGQGDRLLNNLNNSYSKQSRSRNPKFKAGSRFGDLDFEHLILFSISDLGFRVFFVGFAMIVKS
jgi:hypothetical protein